MNHRYSYCKKEAQDQGLGQGVEEEDNHGEEQPRTGSAAASPPSHLDSDERGSSTREDESEEEDEIGSGSLVDEDEIQVVKIGEEGDEDDQGADEDQEGEGERMEEAEQEEGESEENDGQMLKVVVMQDECEVEENGEEERTVEEAMDTGAPEHMKDMTDRDEEGENSADNEKNSENEENTAATNGGVKWRDATTVFLRPLFLMKLFYKITNLKEQKRRFLFADVSLSSWELTVLRREWGEEESVTALTLHLNPLLCINPQVCLINTK